MSVIDDEGIEILRGRARASIGLVDAAGEPHVTPIWIDVDDEQRVIMNTAEGRKKARLLQVGTVVSIAATQADNQYNYVLIKGRVAERTTEGAVEVIDGLSEKYTGRKTFEPPAGQVRVTVVIEPIWSKTFGVL